MKNLAKRDEIRFLSAVITDDVKTVRELLNKGSLNVNTKATECDLPITLIAFLRQSYKVMNLLIERGADMKVKILENEDFLDYVVFNEPFHVLKPIIESGTEVNKHNPWEHIFRALKTLNTDKADIIKALINAGADLNARNVFQETPLLFAVRNIWPDMVEILIRAGSNANACDCERNSAVMMLASDKRPPRMDWQISGWGPKEQRLKILEMMIAAGTDVNRPNVWGKRPIDIATEPEIIKILTDESDKRRF
jgi:ankyrin repeat protein